MTDTITLPRSVVEQALEAFEHLVRRHYRLGTEHDSRAKALRAALEQQQGEQEPVAWMKTWDSVGHARTGMKRVDLTPECETWLANMFPVITPLYTHPQPPRRPLTDQQINDHRLALAYDSEDLPDPWDFKQGVRAAERAHGIGGEK